MGHPNWYALALLTFAAYRSFRLVGEDTITERPRRWLVGLPRDWQDEDPIPDGYRERVALWLQCGWCAGFWHVLGWWAAWLIWPHATLWAATPMAASALVGAVARHLASD